VPYVKSHHAEIYYEVHGEGPPLVRVHGAGGNTVVWWQQIPSFARTHRVIVFDHRCFGKSRCAHEHFEAKYFVDDLVAVLDDAEVERAALVGMSMGGWTVLPTAVRRPERVERLILCGTPGGLITASVLSAMAAVARGSSERKGPALGGAITFSERFRAERPEMVHLYDEISALNTGFDPALLVTMAAAESRVELHELEGYQVPTLIIAAEEDALFPVDVLRETADAIPGCQWADFPGAGHSMYFENPPLFERIVRGFLEEGQPSG
jgi:pimeloyl-ACP methyl ester carboxylesterase